MANEKSNTAATTTPTASLRTKHVAAMFNIKPVSLRRILRTMPAYADGVHTNYRWDPANKKAIDEIGAAIKALEAKRAKAAETAKAELAKKAEEAKKQAAIDKKTA
jgi:hypothetical protein